MYKKIKKLFLIRIRTQYNEIIYIYIIYKVLLYIYLYVATYKYMWWVPLQNDLDTHIIYMIKKIGSINNFFPEIA